MRWTKKDLSFNPLCALRIVGRARELSVEGSSGRDGRLGCILQTHSVRRAPPRCGFGARPCGLL